jgi:hypothetical protein
MAGCAGKRQAMIASGLGIMYRQRQPYDASVIAYYSSHELDILVNSLLLRTPAGVCLVEKMVGEARCESNRDHEFNREAPVPLSSAGKGTRVLIFARGKWI